MALMAVSFFTIAATGTSATAQDTMLPMEITEVSVDDQGDLWATASLVDEADVPVASVDVPINLSIVDIIDDEGDVCAILDLELQAIHLNLLGLQVDTSDICLRIYAEAGQENLLGNLVCGLLGEGLSLEDVLDNLPGGLTDGQLDDLLIGIQNMLNAALEELTSPLSVVGVSSSGGQGQGPGQGKGPGGNGPPGQGNGNGNGPQVCDILNLAVGPVNLDLLGLNVDLDDCTGTEEEFGGPVTVDITAMPGSGNLLGNLLCSLAGLLDRQSLDFPAIDSFLSRIADEILARI